MIKAVNRISAARLVYLDGSAAASDFPLSNAATFVPGAEVEILAGAAADPVSIFKGIVVRQAHPGARQRGAAAGGRVPPRRGAAHRGREERLLLRADRQRRDLRRCSTPPGSTRDVEATTVTHAQQVQFRSSDWDYLLARAEANGKLVFTNDGGVAVRAPRLSGAGRSARCSSAPRSSSSTPRSTRARSSPR